MRWPRIDSRTGLKAFIAIVTILIGAVVSAIFESVLSLRESLIACAIIVTAGVAVYLFIDARMRIEELAQEMETTVDYVEEPYRKKVGEGPTGYKGLPFQKLTKWVSEAQKEVLVLAGVSALTGRLHITSLHETRCDYLSVLEDILKRNENNDFKYVRIQQSSEDRFSLPLSVYESEPTVEHCQRVLAMAQQQHSTSPRVLCIMKIKIERITNFMVIDRRRVVLQVDGIDSEGNTMTIGFFFIEDRRGGIAEHYARYFESLERRATEFTLADFDVKAEEIIDLRQSLEDRGTLSEQFFREGPHALFRMVDHVPEAEEVIFWGITFPAMIAMYGYTIEQGLRNGLKVRILVIKPDSGSVEMAALRHERSDKTKEDSDLRNTLSRLAEMASTAGLAGSLEVRAIDYLPPWTVIATNPRRGDGRMFVLLAAFRVDDAERPSFELKAGEDSKWFNFFVGQFDAAWQASDPVNLVDYRVGR